MNYSFEYIDIILLAMIAGFIFLRLRGILGKRTGFEGKAPPQFEEVLKNIDPKIKTNLKEQFDDEAQSDPVLPKRRNPSKFLIPMPKRFKNFDRKIFRMFI